MPKSEADNPSRPPTGEKHQISQDPRLIIEACSLRKDYAGKKVVDNISFRINSGEFCGILGPNGAGKTTTLRMLVGNTICNAGKLTVLGFPVPAHAQEMRANIGIVPQSDNLDPDLSVIENLFVYGGYFGLTKSRLRLRVAELLSFVSLTEKAGFRISQLSGGMKRRLTIARALINDPKLLILDEPTTGLDPQARQIIWQKLRQLQLDGLTLILTTHYMEEAQRLCDRIIVMDHGHILADQTPHDLISDQIESHVLEVHGSGAKCWADQMTIPESIRTERVAESYYFYGENLQVLMESVGERSELRYSYRPANLEDVFLKLTGRELRDG